MSEEVTQRQRSPSPKGRAMSPEQAERRTNAAKGMKKRSLNQPSFFDKYAYHLVIGGFVLLCLFAIFSILTRSSKKAGSAPVIDDDEISSHNSLNLYQQGSNDFFKDWKLSDAKFIFNNHLTFKGKIGQCTESNQIIPDTYNFRDAHPECVTPVYHQGNCSSSYSIAAVSATSDRLCKQRQGTFLQQLSPQSPVSCDDKNYRCGGGSVTRVLELGKKQGFVTRECMEFKGGDETVNDCESVFSNCEKFKIQDYCVASGEENIKREIVQRGPVVVVMQVFRDFLVYKDGVYEVAEGASKFQYGHAVKVVGWGKKDGTSYWIVENSFGDSWGQKGLAHIAIGSTQLQFEQYALSAIVESNEQEQVVKDSE